MTVIPYLDHLTLHANITSNNQEEKMPDSKTPAVEVPITVRFGDTDPYGVVYFVSYFRYCHKGIEEFLRQLGFRPEETFRNQKEGFGLPIVGAECDFLRPVRYGERLKLTVSVAQAKLKALTFAFEFFRDDSSELVARGRATIVAISSTWQSRILPERLLEALKPYLPSEKG